MNYEFVGWDTLLQVWAPKVLGALAILLVAWLAGRAAKWALAQGIERIPGVKHANLSDDPKRSIGRSLGDVALWLILLFGVVAALSVLGLGYVVTPLSTLLNQIAAFLPNILGAALVFFIGFVVATLARRLTEAALTAASADRWMERAGLSRATGSTGVSTALGTLVFVLVLIPITIAALEQLSIDSLTVPAVAVLTMVFDAIPRVLAAAIVLAVGWLLGRWVAVLVERVLPATGFDSSIGNLARLAVPARDPAVAAPAASDAAASALTPSRIVGRLAMAAIVAFTAVEAARLLEFAALAAMIEDILGLAGRVIVGGLIITAGVLMGDILARLIDKGTAGADRFASSLIRWATIALAVAMGLRFMGIADDIVVLAFGLTLGAAAVAGALAFGLGGRTAAGQIAQQWADRITGRGPRA